MVGVMRCQVCQSRPSTIHITEIVGETKKVVDLCEDCAQEKGVTPGAGLIPTLLASLVSDATKTPTKVCGECGISYEEFRAKGRLGCPNDYEVFAEELGPLLDKIHGARRHRGRLPVGSEPEVLRLNWGRDEHLRRLRNDLTRAVAEEQYEEAARLRDRIRDTERTADDPAGSPAEGGAGGAATGGPGGAS